MRSIGIIGGAGPLASSLLLKNVIQECYRQGCKSSGDLPHIVLVNYPFDFDACMQSQLSAKGYASIALQQLVDQLERENVTTLVIACNTLHLFLPYVQRKHAKLIHMVQAVLDQAKSHGLQRLLILGSPRTMQSCLYDQDISSYMTPSEEHQKSIKKIIQRILSGILLKNDAKALRSIISKSYKQQPFEGVVLGCTELSVLHQLHPLSSKKSHVIVLDSVYIVAQLLAKEALK
jgi:aspartate/glutamate racemase